MTNILSNFKFTKEIKLIFLSTFLFACALGINLVTFPTLLVKNNINPSFIGVASVFEITGGIIASFF